LASPLVDLQGIDLEGQVQAAHRAAVARIEQDQAGAGGCNAPMPPRVEPHEQRGLYRNAADIDAAARAPPIPRSSASLPSAASARDGGREPQETAS